MTLLSPSAVAERRHCSADAVLRAIDAGKLKATPVLGAQGKVTTYAIKRRDADRWKPRRVGRPKK